MFNIFNEWYDYSHYKPDYLYYPFSNIKNLSWNDKNTTLTFRNNFSRRII